MTADTVTIPGRFNGPPGSANGGYTCGLVAAHVGGAGASVRLLAPPPLETRLAVRREDGVVRLMHDDVVVAEGRAGTPEDDAVPAPPSVAEAQDAERRFVYRDPEDHPFPTCFVCGPLRGADGLRLFAGAVDGGQVATAWTPGADLAAGGGVVDPLFVWAALDCPSAAPNPFTGPSVLASLTAVLEDDVRAGEPHVVTAWNRRSEGRKHWASSAIHTADGRRVARADALWITLRAATG